jgi:hypothetical protein
MLKNYSSTKPLSGWLLLVIIGSSFIFYAYSTGITNATLKNGDGCNCHADSPSLNVNVSINGPDTLMSNQTAIYSVTITGGPLVRGGTNIAASEGFLSVVSSDLQLLSSELTHVLPKLPSAGAVSFEFNYTAPSSLGKQIIYANGNSVNFNGQNTGDEWNYAPNKLIEVLDVVPVELETFSALIINNSVILNWKTASETNNYGFEIYRRNNSEETDWLLAGFVQGFGTTTIPKQYSFINENLMIGEYSYKLKQIDFNGSYTFYSLNKTLNIFSPETFALQQNYPNPFNPATTISFSSKLMGHISLKVFNALGIQVETIFDGFREAGVYTESFDAAALPSGVYYYQLIIKDPTGEKIVFDQTKKMLLIK